MFAQFSWVEIAHGAHRADSTQVLAAWPPAMAPPGQVWGVNVSTQELVEGHQ
jgi:hypothetical protein